MGIADMQVGVLSRFTHIILDVQIQETAQVLKTIRLLQLPFLCLQSDLVSLEATDSDRVYNVTKWPFFFPDIKEVVKFIESIHNSQFQEFLCISYIIK